MTADRIPAKIIALDERGLVVAGKYDNYDRAALRQYRDATIILHDSRMISGKQRRTVYMLLGYIGDWMGELTEYVKQIMKVKYKVDVLEDTAARLFSLSDCDMTTANDFITYLIDFILRMDIPSEVPLYELCDDIPKYVYSCLMHKKCAVCGIGKAQLHHFDAVGMGRNRNEICHIGMRVISLCGKCHSIAHQQGPGWITDTYKLTPIPLTAEIGKAFNMTKKQLGGTA